VDQEEHPLYYVQSEPDVTTFPVDDPRMGRSQAPLVIVSSYPPRKCGIATFTEEALEFIRYHMPERPIHIISHLDGRGPNVHPILDQRDPDWYRVVARRIAELRPYAVHIEHEYGLYAFTDAQGHSDHNERFLRLLDMITDIPTVVEPHTVHGRYTEQEARFLRGLVDRCTLLLLKCDYQRWRMNWNLRDEPDNVRVVPHGARPDVVDLNPAECKRRLGLDALQGKRVMGLIGWIQQNKRWDLVLDQWEDLAREAYARTGEEWVLLCAGNLRDPDDTEFFHACRDKALALEARGLARYVEFDPRGEPYYLMMGCYDAVALPSLDETQSGTLARIFALAKPYITAAPLEGLTSQTVESEAGLLFSNQATLRRGLLRLMTQADLRAALAENARAYLHEVVSWDVVAEQYLDAYAAAAARVAVERRAAFTAGAVAE
jgi:glycosyltransferase involved in cell wall biosynthesis